MPPRAGNVTLIGVDGGASSVRAHEVCVEAGRSATQYLLGRSSARRDYPRDPFEPIPLARQLEEQAAGRIELVPAEVARGRVVLSTIVDCVIDVARRIGPPPPEKVCLGIGMPGLKTADGRGIAVMGNGPRIPDLADRIETGLRAAGLRLTEPTNRIGSDADYCGIGEQHACTGLFRDIDHAYYLGGGTGLAEALKLRGVLLPFDRARTWIAKAWEIRSAQGSTFERLVSASAINRRYDQLRTGASPEALASTDVSASLPRERPGGPKPAARYPERYAAKGDAAALLVLETAADALAELIFERIDTIYRGRRALDHRGAEYAGLVNEHEYRGVLLDRVVLGQQIGRLYGDPRTAAVFREKIDGFLAERISADQDAHLRRHYLNGTRLKPGLVVPSRLPAAAALGAAVDAYQRPVRTGGTPEHGCSSSPN